jgi:transcriptional regulator of acetoin/glycerol metabolism
MAKNRGALLLGGVLPRDKVAIVNAVASWSDPLFLDGEKASGKSCLAQTVRSLSPVAVGLYSKVNAAAPAPTLDPVALLPARRALRFIEEVGRGRLRTRGAGRRS